MTIIAQYWDMTTEAARSPWVSVTKSTSGPKLLAYNILEWMNR